VVCEPTLPNSCCDSGTGQCTVSLSGHPECSPVTGICRTPGFWGTHAGTEKDDTNNPSQNITQDVVDACGGCLDVCGGIIENTLLNDSNSAVEALCVSPTGNIKLQLARQLTAMSLNCCMSGAGSDCLGDSSLLDLYNSCNITCTSSLSTSEITSCIERIDCFNNGGNFTAGFCATGTCSDNSAPCTSGNLSQCADPGTATCTPNTNNCHNQPLCSDALGLCFDANAAGADCSDSLYTICTGAPGPAGSSNECSQAIKGTGNGKSNIPNYCAVIPKPSTRDCSDKNQGEECCASGTLDGSCTTCGHAICTTGSALDASCDACVALVCATDPSCCDTSTGAWDATCVGDVSSICNETCP
jgi:hypothetical protein